MLLTLYHAPLSFRIRVTNLQIYETGNNNRSTHLHFSAGARQIKVENDRRSTPTHPKSRPIPMTPLHTARRRSRDPTSSFLFQLRRGQIRNKGLLRTPEPPRISPGSREPPGGQKENK
ncbi:hypothetical protein Bca4012_067352 [Brassica carinata]